MLVESGFQAVSVLLNRALGGANMHLNTVRSSNPKQAFNAASRESSLLGSVLLQLDGDNLSGYVVILKNGKTLEAGFSESLEAVKSGTPLVCELITCSQPSENSAPKRPASQPGSFQSPSSLRASRRLVDIWPFGALAGNWLINWW